MNHVLTFCAAEPEEAAVGELGQVLWRRVGPELDGPVLGRVGHVLGRAQPVVRREGEREGHQRAHAPHRRQQQQRPPRPRHLRPLLTDLLLALQRKQFWHSSLDRRNDPRLYIACTSMYHKIEGSLSLEQLWTYDMGNNSYGLRPATVLQLVS